MKKLLLLTFILCLVLPCFGCNQGDLPPAGDGTTDGTTDETTTEMITDETTGDQQPEIEWIETFPEGIRGIMPVGTMQDLVSRFRNVPIDQLSPFQYTGHGSQEQSSARAFFNIFQSRTSKYRASSGAGSWISPDAWNTASPIQHIVQLDENHVCVVYKVIWEFGTDVVSTYYNDAYHGSEFYAYVMFSRAFTYLDGKEWEVWTRMNNDSGTLLDDDYVELSQANEVYFASRALSSADFAGVRVGDPLKELLDIEPAAYFDMASFTVLWKRRSYLLLEDGILVVSAEGTKEDCTTSDEAIEAMKITKIEFFPHGTLGVVVEGQKLSIMEADNLPPLPPE